MRLYESFRLHLHTHVYCNLSTENFVDKYVVRPLNSLCTKCALLWKHMLSTFCQRGQCGRMPHTGEIFFLIVLTFCLVSSEVRISFSILRCALMTVV